MTDIKDMIIEKCLEVLKRKDVKEDLKELMRPVVDMIIKEIYPYIFLSIVFVIISFLLILGIFILLLRTKISFKVVDK
jgi:hypothetical protein|uniref:Uncharacterized protein n=1 Tax=viral metagenome TaxID=1070528 RepID=A0A6C0BYT9_9ZZZZ